MTSVNNGYLKDLSTASKSIVARENIHQFVIGFVGIVCGSASIIATIEIAKAVFGVMDFFNSGRYFLYKQEFGVSKLPELTKVNNEFRLKDKNYNTTDYLHDIKKGKMTRVIAKSVFIWSAIAGFLSFLDSKKVLSLANWSASFGQMPIIGPLLKIGLWQVQSGALALSGAVIGFSALAIGSANYLYNAHQSGSEKSICKGWLQLTSRIAMAASYALQLVQKSSCLLGMVAGGLGFISAMYTTNRQEMKSKKQEELRKEYMELTGGGS